MSAGRAAPSPRPAASRLPSGPEAHDMPIEHRVDHERQHLDAGLQAFGKVGAKYGILGKGRKEIVEAYGA